MSDNSSSGGIGCVGVLTIVFVTLKLTNLIDWSWWWVLSPIWIMAIVIICLLVGFGVVILVARMMERSE